MSLPQFIRFGVGGTIVADLDYRPESNAVMTVYRGDGTVVANAKTADISSVDTTLASASTRGDRSFTVADPSGIVCGQVLKCEDDTEHVLVRKVDSTSNVVYLRRPMLYDHVSGAGVVCTRVSANVSGSEANAMWWDGRAEFFIDGNDYAYTTCECGTYPMKRAATAQDVMDLDPLFFERIEESEDVERLLDSAHDYICAQIALMSPDMRYRRHPASIEFRRATATAALMLVHGRRQDPTGGEITDTWEKRVQREVSAICQALPSDPNQDGVASKSEKITGTSIRLVRG